MCQKSQIIPAPKYNILNRVAVILEGARGAGVKQIAVKYDLSMSCLNPTPKSFKQVYNRIENIDRYENSIPNIAMIMKTTKEKIAKLSWGESSP